jgi:hypothetical protein
MADKEEWWRREEKLHEASLRGNHQQHLISFMQFVSTGFMACMRMNRPKNNDRVNKLLDFEATFSSHSLENAKNFMIEY